MNSRIRELVPSAFLRFILAGGIAAAVNIASRIALSQILAFEIAIIIAYFAGMTTAFFLMKLFVFERSGKSVPQEYLRFGIVNLFALGQVWLVSVTLAWWIFPALEFNWHAETIAHVIGVLSPIVISYLGHKYFTF